jgi:hypothetical protein
MSSRDKTNKAVSALVEALNDNRFSPFLFASALSVESDSINWQFFQIINEYVNLMAERNKRGLAKTTTEQTIGNICEQMNP